MTQHSINSSDTFETLIIPRPRPWQELAVIAVVFMELSWTVLWYRALIDVNGELSYQRVFLVLGLILIATYLLARIMNYLSIKINIRRGVLIGLAVFSILISMRLLLFPSGFMGLLNMVRGLIWNFRDTDNLLPPEFLLILVVLFVWWRGINLAGTHIGPDWVLKGFRVGIFLTFIYGVLFALDGELPIMALYLFLFFSLLALSSTRIAALGTFRGGRSLAFNRQWLLGILLINSIVLVISGLIFNLLKDRGFDFIFDLFAGLIYLLVLLISPILYFLTWILSLIWGWLGLELMLEIFQDILQRIQNLMGTIVDAFRSWFGGPELIRVRDFLFSLTLLKPYLLWGIVIIVAIMILYSIRRYLWRGNGANDGDYESLAAEEDLFDLLRAAWRRGRKRIAEALDQIIQLRQARRLLAAARIRRIYARLLELSEKLDVPRPPARTPLEFLPSLKRLFPNKLAELETITSAYVGVRYGELPETQEEVEIIEEAWKRVRAEGYLRLRETRKPSDVEL